MGLVGYEAVGWVRSLKWLDGDTGRYEGRGWEARRYGEEIKAIEESRAGVECVEDADIAHDCVDL